MDVRGLVRSLRVVGATRGVRGLRMVWRREHADAAHPPRGPQRARVPGTFQEAEPQPGGGVLRFARSSLLVRVSLSGAVFCGWDGARPSPSYALPGPGPEPDARTTVEPDKDGGWRVVSERVLVTISRYGTVDIRTPGGVVLRRDLPPRWWESAPKEAEPAGAGRRTGEDACWVQRSQVSADARFFGLGARAPGPRLREGVYRLWNGDGGTVGPGRGTPHLTMPVQLVVADAGTHLVFHDNTWDGTVLIWEGVEGAGSGHDQPGRCEQRMSGGPLRYWVLPGAPFRVLRGWATLTGAPAVPPRWALGLQHARWGVGDAAEVRQVANGYRERDLPLHALHLRVDRGPAARGGADLPRLAGELRDQGVRLVSRVDPAIPLRPGSALYDGGTAAGAFVVDARGRQVRGVGRSGESVFPDFTDPRVRAWWGAQYTERLAQGFTGVWHDMNEPLSFTFFGDRTLPRSARHTLEGRGGDHQEAHNVYALAMNQAGYQGLRELRPDERPFVLSRSGWAGMQRYGGLCSGTVESSWAGLRAALALVLGTGLSGVPYAGANIGGDTGAPSAELYLRWFQLGAYLPLFRTQEEDATGPREPWRFGPQVLEHVRAALRERERLLPYFITLAHLAQRDGAPYVRPVWWRTPKDRALRDCEDAFLLGDALLVAPVCEPGVRQRTVRLPRGQWYDTATGAVYRGPGWVTVAAPLARLPVLARAGAVVPVAGAHGGIELEVWAPARGHAGGGLVVADAGDGWQRAEVERFTVQAQEKVPVVIRDQGGPVGYPVRIRGTGG